ncbi:MAG TPA: hypothetical protein VKC66_38625 [Xanthobacteraceae bacterium]|nr:hypothetical protein [Xanthobacteraceae bacterium]
MRIEGSTRRRVRRIASVAIATTFLTQNFAWAVCSDGVATVPAAVGAGFQVATTYNLGPGPWNPAGGATVLNPNNWSPGIYTATANSLFIPDISGGGAAGVLTGGCENNDCTTKPLTGGGHNWTFDQGSTLCKAHYEGAPGGAPTAWSNPVTSPTDCIFTDVITGEQVIVLDVNGTLVTITTPITRGITDVPYQGEVLTPTCDPTQYGPIPVGAPAGTILGPGLPSNTFINHLGCSISHGVATEPHGATTYMWVAGIHGGMFVIPLNNITPQVGGPAGKIPGGHDFYAGIPLGQKLTTAAVSPDGRFAMATSLRRSPIHYTCFNPLGDPERRNDDGSTAKFPVNGTDPVTGGFGIDQFFFVQPAGSIKCIQSGANGLAVTLSNTFGSDYQPYFGGRRTINSYDSDPGYNINTKTTFPTAWPQCIGKGNTTDSIFFAFNHGQSNLCLNAVPNGTMDQAGLTQPQTTIRHVVFPGVPTYDQTAAQANRTPSLTDCPNSPSAFPQFNGWSVNTCQSIGYFYAPPIGGTVAQLRLVTDAISGLTVYQIRTYITGLSLVTGLGVDDGHGAFVMFSDPSAIGAPGREFVTLWPLCEDMGPNGTP